MPFSRLVFRVHALKRMAQRSISITEETMTCVICKQSETEPGTTTVTLERGVLTLVVKGVPARICPICSEE